ncbi:MAG TPA: phosphoribosylaminoimidazolesuccinocarboxamide synthase [Bacteroidetes bacterium]|nr:phosphoribosylaminoimidazolesuccinocarboxamide synthase [Bacteroidota bacterium]|tara:strand:+ start:620 stop:1540 length:921 start_codon:yes stop_codon:yes gene_type:complete
MNLSLALNGQVAFYQGKVRDVYFLDGGRLAIVASDRISAFDHILPRAIPGKGQMLNDIAYHFLQATEHIIPNWSEALPHKSVTIGKTAEPIKIEMVVRGFLCGHALRQYKAGERKLCGASMPDGMLPYQAFPKPIITPATKADQGEHDEDISPREILNRGIVSEDLWQKLASVSLELFAFGQQMASERGLLLADTKYEFGLIDGELILIDEIHTPDSSRYFYADGFNESVSQGKSPKHLSKEFVREWLMSKGFQGLDGDVMPVMEGEDVQLIRDRYMELYETMLGRPFLEEPMDNLQETINVFIQS